MPIRRWRCSPSRRRRNAAARRLPLQPQRIDPASRRRADARGAQGLVELELRRQPRDAVGPVSVTYWMNRLQAIPEAKPLFVIAQSARRAARRSRRQAPDRSSIRSSTRERSPPKTNSGRCRAAAASGSVGPISARVSMKMVCRPASRSPRRSGDVRRPWRVDDESGAHPDRAGSTRSRRRLA